MNKTLANILAAIIPNKQHRKKVRSHLVAGRGWPRTITPPDKKPYIAWKSESPEESVRKGLFSFAKDYFSQYGEDGILEHIFSVIGARSKYAVEFGAWDGKYCSNIFNLVRNHGWQALMIEGNSRKMAALRKTAQEVDGRIEAVNGCVGIKKYPLLDTYLGNCPKEPDILSIDVDGLEYHIWESLQTCKPRVVVVEFNPSIPSDIIFIQAKNESVFEGASATALVDLGLKKGYSLAAITGGNLVFVDDAEFAKLGIEDNSLENLWFDAPRSRIFHTYSGKIYTWGMPHLLWGGAEIEPDALQFYSSFQWKDGNELV